MSAEIIPYPSPSRSDKEGKKAKDDLPLPLTPDITTKLLRGISTVMFFRLCVRAP